MGPVVLRAVVDSFAWLSVAVIVLCAVVAQGDAVLVSRSAVVQVGLGLNPGEGRGRHAGPPKPKSICTREGYFMLS